jgi:hypothetical protein
MHVLYDPSIVPEARQCAHDIKQLRLELKYKMEVVNRTATAEEADLKSQLIEVRIRKLAEIQKIETEYHAQIEEKQSELSAIIKSRPGSCIGARVGSSRTATFDSRARTEPLLGETMDPSSLQNSDSHHPDIVSSWTGNQEGPFLFESTGNDPPFRRDEWSSGLQDDLDLNWDNPSY